MTDELKILTKNHQIAKAISNDRQTSCSYVRKQAEWPYIFTQKLFITRLFSPL